MCLVIGGMGTGSSDVSVDTFGRPGYKEGRGRV